MTCPDCGNTEITTLLEGEVNQYRCAHCGQVWQERDGVIEAKTFGAPPGEIVAGTDAPVVAEEPAPAPEPQPEPAPAPEAPSEAPADAPVNQ